jgi:hypothetical protein
MVVAKNKSVEHIQMSERSTLVLLRAFVTSDRRVGHFELRKVELVRWT